MNRSIRVAAAMVVLTVAGNAIGASPVAARGLIVSGTTRHTPLPAGDILSRASAAPLPAFATRPFKVTAYTIRTLDWSSLHSNGLALPRLAKPPNSDRDGIPYKVVAGRNYYHPGNIASSGLSFVDAYVRTGDPAYLQRAVVRARKLVEIAIPRDGALFFPYRFDYPNERLKAPWFSAYSQGFALSLFVRLYRVTGTWEYLDQARAVALSFRRLGAGTRPWVAYAPAGYLWLEEYPSSRPTHVLNGFNFAAFGLYEYERLTRDPVAGQLLSGAVTTMRRYAATYRVPGGISFYDLVHRTQLAHYHTIHIWQLALLGRISGDPYFGQLSAAFRADHS